MDWKRIKAEYVAGGTTYRRLAEKYGVSRTTLERKAKNEKWTELRRQAEGKATARIVDAVSREQANRACKINDVADKLLDKISDAIDTMSVINSQVIKHYTSALKDLKDIKGIKSDMDLREQQARIDKLEREAQAQDDGQAEICVTFVSGDGEDLSEWAK